MEIEADTECAKVMAETKPDVIQSSPNGKTHTPEEGTTPVNPSPVNGKTDGKDEKSENGTSSENGGAGATTGQERGQEDSVDGQAIVKATTAAEVTQANEAEPKLDKSDDITNFKEKPTKPSGEQAEGASGGVLISESDTVEATGEAKAKETNGAETDNSLKSDTTAETDEKRDSCDIKSAERVSAGEEGDVNNSSATVVRQQEGSEAMVEGKSGDAIASSDVDIIGKFEVPPSAGDDNKTTEKKTETQNSENQDNNEPKTSAAEKLEGETIVSEKAEAGGDSGEAIESDGTVSKKLIPQISITEAEPIVEEEDVKIVFDDADSKKKAENPAAESTAESIETSKPDDVKNGVSTPDESSDSSKSNFGETGEKSKVEEASEDANSKPPSAESTANGIES